MLRPTKPLPITLVLVAAVLGCHAHAGAAEWRAGVARLKITPERPMWLSGYGARDRAAEGTLTELWAKALALVDPAGGRAVLVTLDLIGIDRELSLAVRRAIAAEHGLELRHVVLSTSHTHTGPVVGGNLAPMYSLDAEQQQLVADYAARLRRALPEVARGAFDSLASAELSWGIGRAEFAVNRRENRPEGRVPEWRVAGTLKGPVDHDVPVLAVRSGEELRAVVVGYACHCTVLSFYRWSGDYAGFAQEELEARHPGAMAMFWAGCGADVNPLPRRTVELARRYGHELAKAADTALAEPLRPVRGQLHTAYAEIDLPFAALPTRASLVERLQSEDRFQRSYARHLLTRLEEDGALPGTYPYPVQTWGVGDELHFVVLGGEVVVDYALRLKRELGLQTTFVMGYANDVMAYIPSERVLAEGGYEGGGAMVYYGQPAVWAAGIEDAIVAAVHRQVDHLGRGHLRAETPGRPEPPTDP